MTISLLHIEDSQSTAIPIDPRVVYHLSVDRIFCNICIDEKKLDYFLQTIENLTNDRREIEYRREVLRDFMVNTNLLTQMAELFDGLDRSKEFLKRARNEAFRIQTQQASSIRSEGNLLQIHARCMKQSLLIIKELSQLLSKLELKSAGLKKLLLECQTITMAEDFERMMGICSKYENFSCTTFDIKVKLNDIGRVMHCELIDHRYIRISDPNVKKKGLGLFRRAAEENYPCEEISPETPNAYDSIIISAVRDLLSLFYNLTSQIYDRFLTIRNELDFYFVATRYVDVLASCEIPICFPQISETDIINVRDLFDLYLIVAGKTASIITPNSITIDKDDKGIVIFGANGSGKTVFLRSLGCMQLLAQAGLPIPCERAEITLFSQIATQFSESEKEFHSVNDAGRFEQEVRELAAMVDSLSPGALVLLNETFQSTAYAEGAEGLKAILDYFSEIKIRWILVTHLNQLEDDLWQVKVLRTTDKYKIV